MCDKSSEYVEPPTPGSNAEMAAIMHARVNDWLAHASSGEDVLASVELDEIESIVQSVR